MEESTFRPNPPVIAGFSERKAESKRQTIADEIFEHLLNEIISLKIKPDTQLSEAEVARVFEVSRQPVREAFMRLGGIDLLLIQPQKATRVKKISLADIEHNRFIRLAIEMEVVRTASMVATDAAIVSLRQSLDQQGQARDANDPLQMQALDYDFHRLICQAADQPKAFIAVSEYKKYTDRVCTLEMADDVGMAETIEGHTLIVDAIVAKDPDVAMEVTRRHLAHLDLTLENAEKKFPDFFED